MVYSLLRLAFFSWNFPDLSQQLLMLITCSFLLLSCVHGWGGPQLSLTSHPLKDTWILWVKLRWMFVYQLPDENKSSEINTQDCNSWVIWWVSVPFGFERNCQTFAEWLPSHVRATSCLTSIWWDPDCVLRKSFPSLLLLCQKQGSTSS